MREINKKKHVMREKEPEETSNVGKILTKIMECGLFDEVKDLNQYNFKTQSKQLVSAPQEAEKYCELFESKEKKEKSGPASIYFADFESFTKDNKGNPI
jgi:hypothetical protein